MRPNVAKFIDYWRDRLEKEGAAKVRDELRNKKTVLLSPKDRREILRELGL